MKTVKYLKINIEIRIGDLMIPKKFTQPILLLFILTTFYINVNAQNEILLDVRKSLSIKLSDFSSRTVNPQNMMEYLLIRNEFISPLENEKLFENDTSSFVWKQITKNNEAWYEDENLHGGYAYLEIYSDKEKNILLEGSAYSMVYVNREPRAGNVYQYKDEWQSWEPNFGFSYLPIKLKKGKNEFLFKCNYGRFKVRFFETEDIAQLNIKDLTIPDVRVGEKINHFGGIIIINNSDSIMRNLIVETEGEGLEKIVTAVPIIQPLSTRKVKFDFKGKAVEEKSNKAISVKLIDSNSKKILDNENIEIRILNTNETYKQTFISNIDGSVQFFAVNPAGGNDKPKALFLSLHGAAVNADNQANSYYSKNWGIIVSPTNRRPYGFNWEDWGRLDAMEVFDIALEKFNIDPSRIYLTGHSMGGHGTWHIGSTFPDRFAAIGPSAGWISFWSYRFNDNYEKDNAVLNLINRTGNPSNTYAMAENYNQLGVYIIHGADDDNVRATQSHSIIKELEKSHKDFIYHEEKDAGHWWDKSDEQGADCVDWAPMFDYFAKHARPEKSRKLKINFITASPGISEKNNWVTIYRQEKYLEYSKVDLQLDPGIQRISGSTENVSIIGFDTDILDKTRPIKVVLDGQTMDEINMGVAETRIWLNRENGKWALGSEPNKFEKSPQRYCTFKDAFRNNVVFVYGTIGSNDENEWAFAKAKYDSEQFWYQGNGAIEVISDSEFNSTNYEERNIIVYGNSETNSAWKILLANSPIQVNRECVRIKEREFLSNDLACLFIRPKENNKKNLIGVISGTGIIGLKLSNSIPFMSPGFTYPDVTVFSSELLTDKERGYRAAGFFGYDWSVKKGEFEFND